MPEELKQLIRDLDADVKALAAKYRRERIRTVLLAAVVVAAIVYGWLYVQEASARRRQIYGGFCFLISTTPDDPAQPFIHTYREHFGCPPYDAAKAQQELKPAPTATVTRPGTTHTRVIPTTVPTTMPGPTRTVTVPTRTVTRTVTRTRTVTQTATLPPCLQNPTLHPCTLQAAN